MAKQHKIIYESKVSNTKRDTVRVKSKMGALSTEWEQAREILHTQEKEGRGHRITLPQSPFINFEEPVETSIYNDRVGWCRDALHNSLHKYMMEVKSKEDIFKEIPTNGVVELA